MSLNPNATLKSYAIGILVRSFSLLLSNLLLQPLFFCSFQPNHGSSKVYFLWCIRNRREKENFGDAEDFSSAFNPLKISGRLMGVAV